MAEPSADTDVEESRQSRQRLKGCLVRTLCVVLSVVVIAVGLFTLFCVREARARRWREVSGRGFFADIETRFGCTMPKTVSDVRAVERREGGWERRILSFKTSSDDFNSFLAALVQGRGWGPPHVVDSKGFPLLEGPFDRKNAPQWLIDADARGLPMGYRFGGGPHRMYFYVDEKGDGKVIVYIVTEWK